MDWKPTYMRASKAADAIGILKETLTQWVRRGKIAFHTTTGGHRLLRKKNKCRKRKKRTTTNIQTDSHNSTKTRKRLNTHDWVFKQDIRPRFLNQSKRRFGTTNQTPQGEVRFCSFDILLFSFNFNLGQLCLNAIMKNK